MSLLYTTLTSNEESRSIKIFRVIKDKDEIKTTFKKSSYFLKQQSKIQTVAKMG